jgi:hypothetical protein
VPPDLDVADAPFGDQPPGEARAGAEQLTGLADVESLQITYDIYGGLSPPTRRDGSRRVL